MFFINWKKQTVADVLREARIHLYVYGVTQDLGFGFRLAVVTGIWLMAYTDAAPHFRRVFSPRFFRLPLSF